VSHLNRRTGSFLDIYGYFFGNYNDIHTSSPSLGGMMLSTCLKGIIPSTHFNPTYEFYMKPILACLLIIALSCQDSRTRPNAATIEIIPLRDSCYHLMLKGQEIAANRKLNILENTLTDTILLGFTIVAPNYTGEVIYLQKDTVTSNSFYQSSGDDENLPKTKSLCIHLYQKKAANGKIRVQYFY
jgi:hypothetical protein